MYGLEGKKVLVMGLGLNQGGLSVVKFLHRQGALITVTDLRTKAILKPTLESLKKLQNIRYVFGKHNSSDFADADLIFRNPAVPANSKFLTIAKKNHIPITNEAAFFVKHCPAKIIGVTGTRGKSTTTSIIYNILNKSLKGKRIFLTGNIAKDGFLSVLTRVRKNDIVVAEFSSFQLELLSYVKKSPYIAVITPIYHDHLNRYNSFRAYVKAKAEIVRYQKNSDYCVVNIDNSEAMSLGNLSKGKKIFVSNKQSNILPSNKHIVFNENALAALAVAKLMSISQKKSLEAIKQYRGLDFRFQQIPTRYPFTVINDSCSTAPVATEKAISIIKTPITLIAGGVDKKLSYKKLAMLITKHVDTLILLPGTGSRKLKKELSILQFKGIWNVKTLRAATMRAISCSSPKSTLLFSPAAASFNLFLNEFDRGRKFSAIIKNESKKRKKK